MGVRRLVWLLVLLSLGVFLTGCAPSGVPRVQDVASAQFYQDGIKLAGSLEAEPLVAEKSQDRAVIAKLVGWLNIAPVVGHNVDPPPSMGYCTVTFHLRSGKDVILGQTNGAISPDQVMLWSGSKPPQRLRSAELARWLKEGYKQDVQQQPIPVRTPSDAVSLAQRNLPRWPELADFSTQGIGVVQGSIAVGGPAQNRLLATFETTATANDKGYAVQFIRRWRLNNQDQATTWTVQVDTDCTVHEPVKSGDELPAVK